MESLNKTKASEAVALVDKTKNKKYPQVKPSPKGFNTEFSKTCKEG